MSGPGAGADREPGTSFGPYRLRARLGRGGYGEVWRAVDSRTGADVALKRLFTTDDVRNDIRNRFRREVELTRRLNSVHVIPIHDAGEVDDQLYLSMRLVAGGDLHNRLHSRPRPDPVWAARVTGQIAHALGAAHTAGIVHRDVKPANVLVEDVAGEDFCYLADFGIARMIDESAGRLTHSTDLVGTLSYMAPELFRSSRNAGRPSDVYALGCVLYELLTGRPPFTAPDVRALMHQHLEWTPEPPSATAPVPPAFDAVLARALAKRPEERFPDVGGLAAAALDASASPGPSVPDDAPRRTAVVPPSVPRPAATRAAPRRRAWLLAVPAAVVLLGGGTVAGIAATGSGPPPTLGPRPATLAVAGVDACSLLSPASRDRLDLGPPSLAVETFDPSGPLRCSLFRKPQVLLPGTRPISDPSQFWTLRVNPDRSAQDVLNTTAGAEVVDVSGYSAVAGPVEDKSEDTACRVTVDAAPAASVAVDYSQYVGGDDTPIGRDAACDVARQAAVEIVATLRSRG